MDAAEKKRLDSRLLLLVTTPKLAEAAAGLFERGQIPILHQFCAEGTASDEIMAMLGLGSTEKTVLLGILPKVFADEMLKKLKKELKIGTSNSGIAVTLSMLGASSRLIKILEAFNTEHGSELPPSKGETRMSYTHVLILAIVNRGFSQEVMNAARPVGAGGGTVINSRRIVNEETMKFWGISLQQEREVVGIVAETEVKLAIMKAIGEKCGIHSDAHGIVLALPVDGVIGLE